MGRKTRNEKKDAGGSHAKPKPPELPLEIGPAASGKTKGAWPAIFIVLLALVFLSVVRLRVADVPLERDEGEYAYSGQLILQGFPPYQLAHNMKFPGTYYAYAALLAMFGETTWGIHAGLLLVNVATIALVFFLAKRVLGDSAAAAVSAIAFGFLSVDRWIMGVFGHATHFVVFAAVAGLLVLFHALESRRPITFVLAGALLGASVIMKQNGIFFLGAGLGIAGWSEIASSPRRWRQAAVHATLIAAGGAVAFGFLCIVLYTQGVFGKFWFWTFQYAKEYVTEVSFSDGWTQFSDAVTDITRANPLIWLFAGTGIILLWLTRWSMYTRILLSGLLLVSFAAVCPGFYFRQHYFILLLPAAALFCGVAFLSLDRVFSSVVSKRLGRVAASAVFAIAVGHYVIGEWSYFFSISPEEISRQRYGANPFVEAPEIARYIRTHTNDSDRIAVLGSEPQIYFYSRRKSATGYIYTYPLMERQSYSQRMQNEMIAEITAAHPKYVVYVGIPMSWLAQNSNEKILTWSQAYLGQCYDVAGVTDIVPGEPTKYVWEAAAETYRPRSQFLLATFKAKNDEPCAVP